MHEDTVRALDFSHQVPDLAGASESKVRWVAGLTLVTMFIEIGAGLVSGSKALEADGWHMGTHAGAIGLAAAAYWFARTRSGEPRYSFGAGKVYALAGWTNAVLLGVAAAWMVGASLWRLARPVEVHVHEAMPVAVLGLFVNLVSAWLLMPAAASGAADRAPPHGHDHDHGHEHGHSHAHGAVPVVEVPPPPPPPAAIGHGHAHEHADLNHRGAYLHVVMDLLTSVLAIVALLGVWSEGWTFLDPLMGLLGGFMVLRWGWSLLGEAAGQLLDVAPSEGELGRVRARLESIDDVRVADLHVWELGFGRRACMATVVTHQPRSPRVYRDAIREVCAVQHLTVEVHPCAPPCGGGEGC